MMFGLFNNKKYNYQIPGYWKNYLARFEEKENYRKPISEGKFVVIDVESNGLDPKKDKILSIGAVKIINNQIEINNSFEIYLDQSVFNPEVVPIHGILQNGNTKKVSEEEAVRKFINYIDNYIIVGHSIKFDISIINETLKTYVKDKLLNKSLDTVTLYKRLKGGDYKSTDSTSLDALSDEFNIPKSDRHNAAGDALITAILFLKLTARLKQRGVKTLSELLKSKNNLL